MIETIIAGIGFGIVLSIIGGAVFFVLLKTSIEKGFHAGVSFAAGVLLSDIVFVALVIYGSSYLALENQYRLPIGITGSAILLSIGIYYLFKKPVINYEDKSSKRHNTGYFLKGFFMCIFNPAVLLYWISVAGGAISITGQFNPKKIIPLFASILITQFSLDVTKAYYANKLRYRIKAHMISKLNKVAGVLVILFAIRMILNLILGHSLI
jgi:threonine/homoserine/homoserine lactone efflux protein